MTTELILFVTWVAVGLLGFAIGLGGLAAARRRLRSVGSVGSVGSPTAQRVEETPVVVA